MLPLNDGCNNDKLANNPQINSGFFIYGLLGRRPHWEKPDSNHFWTYMRIFNHPEVQDIKIELIHGKKTIPLEETYRDYDKFFTEGRKNFYFNPDETYGVKIWDSKHVYSGEIITLPRLEITLDTVIAETIKLKWSDINADFYNVEFRNYPEFVKHFQVTKNSFEIALNDLPTELFNKFYIRIAGFKGFNPVSKPGGNISGCYGFLFAYSLNTTELDLETMHFSKPKHKVPLPNLDDLVLSLLKTSTDVKNDQTSKAIGFKFTYGYLSNSSYSSSGWNNFYGATIVEPANTVDIFEGYVNNVELATYQWAGFYNSLRSVGNIYEEYDKLSQFKFKLNINNQRDSAIVAVPDTFSLFSYPSTDQIPVAPFTVKWRQPDNADYFFVNALWEVKDDSLDKNFLYVTDKNYFTFNEIPDSTKYGIISVVAINGASPIKSLEPNLKKLNGYFYSRRRCRKSIYFSEKTTERMKPSRTGVGKENSIKLFEKIDQFLLSCLEKKYPELRNHKQKILNELIKRDHLK